MMNKCVYCQESDNHIRGKSLKYYDFKSTAGYRTGYIRKCDIDIIDFLDLFILRGAKDKKAGLMIDSGYGFRYIDITYCPFCGRKLDNEVIK